MPYSTPELLLVGAAQDLVLAGTPVSFEGGLCEFDSTPLNTSTVIGSW